MPGTRTHTHTRTYTHSCARTCTHTHTHTHTVAHAQTVAHAHTHTQWHTCTHTYTHTQAIVGKIKTYHKLLKSFATNGKLELALLLVVQVCVRMGVSVYVCSSLWVGGGSRLVGR